MSLSPLVDEIALGQWLGEKLPGEVAPIVTQRVGDGKSNETFWIKRGSQEWILRRPPRGPLPPTAHDVMREWRLLTALYGSVLAVPQPVLACEDASIIGAPFYLMEKVAGYVIRTELPPQFDSDQARREISQALIRTLVKLHSLDYNALGLSSLGKPDGYLARQLKRWSSQLENNRTRPLPDLDWVGQWLHEHLPPSPPATIVHGDYRLDNVMLGINPPAEVAAVLDWEMATLGDPLADVGYLLSFWVNEGEPIIPFASDMGVISSQPGFMTRAEAAAYYAELSGRTVENLLFYEVLAIWKLAILREGNYKRWLAGTTDNPYFTTYEEAVPFGAARARAICESETL